jgi:monofunctional biosynthetic peptidoglycan transglycosylase
MPKKKSAKGNRLKRVLAVAGFLFAALVSAVLFAFITAPDVTPLRTKNPRETAMMRYREARAGTKGQRIGRIQYWVPLSRISPFLVQAVLISEDDKFYAHEGFDWKGIADALEKNIKSGHIVGGGSTITQQLAKNLYLKPTRNPLRKMREAAIAFMIDKRLKKSRILELYLNVIEWGRGVYGAEAASRMAFGKASFNLTLAEAVRLATVLPNPLRYQADSDAVRWLREKRRLIGERMLMKHWITEGQFLQLRADVDPESFPLKADTTAAQDSSLVRTDGADASPKSISPDSAVADSASFYSD